MRAQREYYTKLPCPCCGQKLKTLSKNFTESIFRYFCTNLLCHRYLNYEQDGTYKFDRESPFEITAYDEHYLDEIFFNETNPIMGIYLRKE